MWLPLWINPAAGEGHLIATYLIQIWIKDSLPKHVWDDSNSIPRCWSIEHIEHCKPNGHETTLQIQSPRCLRSCSWRNGQCLWWAAWRCTCGSMVDPCGSKVSCPAVRPGGRTLSWVKCNPVTRSWCLTPVKTPPRFLTQAQVSSTQEKTHQNTWTLTNEGFAKDSIYYSSSILLIRSIFLNKEYKMRTGVESRRKGAAEN